MNAGQLLLLVADLVTVLKTDGILLPDGTFDKTKVDSIAEDVALTQQVLTLLEAYGVNAPERVDKILQLLPLLASIIR